MDENTPNAVVSYYAKGSLIALALDLLIREQTKHQQSLDDVMRHLWQMYQLTQEGIGEEDVDRAIETGELGGSRAAQTLIALQIEHAVRVTADEITITAMTHVCTVL